MAYSTNFKFFSINNNEFLFYMNYIITIAAIDYNIDNNLYKRVKINI